MVMEASDLTDDFKVVPEKAVLDHADVDPTVAIKAAMESFILNSIC